MVGEDTAVVAVEAQIVSALARLEVVPCAVDWTLLLPRHPWDRERASAPPRSSVRQHVLIRLGHGLLAAKDARPTFAPALVPCANDEAVPAVESPAVGPDRGVEVALPGVRPWLRLPHGAVLPHAQSGVELHGHVVFVIELAPENGRAEAASVQVRPYRVTREAIGYLPDSGLAPLPGRGLEHIVHHVIAADRDLGEVDLARCAQAQSSAVQRRGVSVAERVFAGLAHCDVMAIALERQGRVLAGHDRGMASLLASAPESDEERGSAVGLGRGPQDRGDLIAGAERFVLARQSQGYAMLKRHRDTDKSIAVAAVPVSVLLALHRCPRPPRGSPVGHEGVCQEDFI